MSARLASGLVALCAALVAGVGAHAAVLPGSAEFPLVQGSAITPCPTIATTSERVCVSIPRDEQAQPIIEAYQLALRERGFERQDVGSPSVALFARIAGQICEVILVGSPYLEPEQRASTVMIEFQYNRGPAEECAS